MFGPFEGTSHFFNEFTFFHQVDGTGWDTFDFGFLNLLRLEPLVERHLECVWIDTCLFYCHRERLVINILRLGC